MAKILDLTKHADRVLKNYRNFQKLASLSNKPFSVRGQELVDEIERVIDCLVDLQQAILVNLYLKTTKEKKSRKAFCEQYQISVKEYDHDRVAALVEFAKYYRGGALAGCEVLKNGG